MDMEQAAGLFLMGMCGIITGWIIITCFISPIIGLLKNKISKNKPSKNTVREISMDELNEILASLDIDNRGEAFWTIAKEYIERGENLPPSGAIMSDTEYVEVLAPCAHHDCAQHVTRADCCHSCIIKDGKEYCKYYININKLCGLESKYDRPPELLSDEECKVLVDQLVKFIKETRGI